MFDDRRLKAVFQHWTSRCGTRVAPLASDFDPLDLPADLLPCLHVIVVGPGQRNYHHGLVGSLTVQWLRRDASHNPVSAAQYGTAGEEVLASLDAIAASAQPHRRLSQLTWTARPLDRLEAVELPLLDVDGTVTAIVRGMSFRPGAAPLPARLLHTPLTR